MIFMLTCFSYSMYSNISSHNHNLHCKCITFLYPTLMSLRQPRNNYTYIRELALWDFFSMSMSSTNDHEGKRTCLFAYMVNGIQPRFTGDADDDRNFYSALHGTFSYLKSSSYSSLINISAVHQPAEERITHTHTSQCVSADRNSKFISPYINWSQGNSPLDAIAMLTVSNEPESNLQVHSGGNRLHNLG